MLLDKQAVTRIYKLGTQLSQENKNTLNDMASCHLQVGLVIDMEKANRHYNKHC